ncbi:helix-turn-helix domain-containing protein [Pseudarthrobacter enclensis]|uniref:helix-turn-helix domain-containing protein n=1 Tax=Pseudarthrobacter enclensis TaxID=993070 RepID=UPI003593ED60
MRYSFESKFALVERLAAGETAQDLASEAGLSSPKLLETWAPAYRREGPDALRPEAKGRPGKPDALPPSGATRTGTTSPGERTPAG